MDGIRKRMDAMIAETGWWVQAVLPGPDSPSFAYSVGMTETFGHPEVMVMGFSPELMHTLINGIGELVREGARFGDRDSSDKVIRGYPVVFREPEDAAAAEFALAAVSRYGKGRFRLLQCFLPDAQGRFPWDEGCEEGCVRHQGALLDRMASKGLS